MALPVLAQWLPGRFSILNMRGSRVAGSAEDHGLFARVLVPARAAQVLALEAGDPRLAGRAPLQLVSQPLTGANGAVIGSLVWSREAGADAQRDRRFALSAAAQIAAVLALGTGRRRPCEGSYGAVEAPPTPVSMETRIEDTFVRAMPERVSDAWDAP